MTALRGIRMGVDVGTARVGVALSDPDGILATPLATLVRDAHTGSDLVEAAELVATRQVVEVVVGLPITMAGREGASAAMAREWAEGLRGQVGEIPVVMVDERLTTVAATQALHASGRKTKSHRAVIDQAAAVALLQGYLDQNRSRA